jgi:hypothetical protein
VLDRVQALKPGVEADEQAFASFMPIARMSVPEPGLDWTADDWIDRMDLPNDPVGRAQREQARDAARPAQHSGIDRLTDAMLARAGDMVAQARTPEFLSSVGSWAAPLMAARWEKSRAVRFQSAVMARRAALSATEEDRIAREVERARYLAENGLREEADALWAGLVSRIGALPEGAARMRAEVERAGYVERTRGVEAAAAEWAALSARYPWSLGLLEDRLAFLARTGRGGEGRRVLAAVIPRAAEGHREELLQRLTREALEAGDLLQARRAVEQLLPTGLEEARRLAVVHLFARLSFKEGAGFDALPLARSESERLRPELHADLYARLAEAAELEKAWGAAVTLWIEALNRRTERAWLGQAARAADRAGRFADLLGFFDAQRVRSPRDVRWAVAVRELKRHASDLPGAIEMAQAAVAVRPEQEQLWREAVDLMVRADRVQEAAEYLEGWNRPRAADEDVARWRGELFARAGQGEKALAVERAALAAFEREGERTEERREELRHRTARAARRLQGHGYPRLAWGLLGGPVLAKVSRSGYDEGEQARLALLTGNFDRMLRHRMGDTDYRRAAASVIRQNGRTETRHDVQQLLLGELFPAAGTGGSMDVIWPLVQEAGLERQMRFAIARRQSAAAPGPWQADPSVSFLDSVGQVVVGGERLQDGSTRWTLAAPDYDALWVRELVRRDDGPALAAFLAGRWSELLQQVHAQTPVLAGADRLAWTAWLDDPAALRAWVRAAGPAGIAELGPVFASRREWDRFWTLAARGWTVAPLVEALPVEARTAWFRFWESPSAPADPVKVARDRSREAVSLAVGRLVAGQPGAAADPLIEKLRGPRTVGELVGRDPRWTWPEFTPRRDAKGEVAEVGEDRVFGQRADEGRLPGALWGDRPGEAWYVLETLARYRQGDPEAPLVPLDVPERAGQPQRAFLAIRLAEAAGNTALALELEQAFPGRTQDAAWLEMRLRVLVNAGQRDRAEVLFRQVVRQQQAALDEARFRALSGLAQDLGLTPPLDLLDPATPVSPGFLAWLFDRRGAETAARFSTPDLVGFRAALSSRWSPREGSLTAAQVRYALDELWAAGAMDLPRRGLRKLPGTWPHAAEWLAAQRIADRKEALAALAALPDNAAFEALASRAAPDDVVQRLRVRIHLARGEDDRALALVDELVRGHASEQPLVFDPPAPEAAPEEGEWSEGEGEPAGEEPVQAEPDDRLVAQLEAWLAPFREVKRPAPVEERFRALLKSRRDRGPVSIAAWRLALELATAPEERARLLADIEHAWVRGDWSPEGLAPLVETLARLAPEEAPRWLARWPASYEFEHVARRAAVYRRLRDRQAERDTLVEGRRRALWSAADEVRAFDLWRRAMLAPPAGPATAARGGTERAPAAWTAALPFWRMKPGEVAAALGPHLEARPYDILAARAALRTAAPGPEEALRRAALTLEDPTMDALDRPDSDRAFLRLRIARGLLPGPSPRAPIQALGPVDPRGLAGDLARRRIPRAQVDEVLADVARIAARASDTPLGQSAMALLIDRRAANLKAVRAELRELERPQSPPAPFRLVNGAPAPYRPRDLSWAVLATVLAAEEGR